MAAQSITVDVYDHSNASLRPHATKQAETINFGNVLQGATIPSQSFTIYNRAANTSAAYTANLKLTGFTASGDPALTTNRFAVRWTVAGRRHHLHGIAEYQQLHHDGNHYHHHVRFPTGRRQHVAGCGQQQQRRHHHHAERQRRQRHRRQEQLADFLRHRLDRPVAQNASYANLESKATATTGSGGYQLVGSTATILAGTNSSGSAQTVSMAWRTQTLSGANKPRAD